jgi:glucose/arabinose dehydrogenase
MLKRVTRNSANSCQKRVLLTALGFVLLLGISACGPQPTAGLPSIPALPTAPASIITPTETPAPAPLPTSTNPPTTTPYLNGFPDLSGYQWAEVVSGLNLAVDIQNAGDGSGRLFIVEKRGLILILQNDQLLAKPFLDIQSKVGSQHTEQGLLGLAFHDKFRETGVFFVNYTDMNGNTVIAQFHVSADDPNRADPTSEVDLLHVDQPYANHNGGGLAFGPDGYLYIGLGDGGSAGDPLRNAQNLQTLLGKLLRINVDASGNFSIPPDNPFIGGGGLAEIWGYGLRNPWRFSFDRLTGNLYIGDVGQDAWEEVDFVPAGTPGGLNFGWSYFEGTHSYQDQPPAGSTFISPVAEYSHADGCSVTGGYVYRGQALPEWQGVYFYGDYCSGNVWGLIQTGQDSWQSKLMFSTSAKITTFGVDESGEIYLSDYQSGTILRLTHR